MQTYFARTITERPEVTINVTEWEGNISHRCETEWKQHSYSSKVHNFVAAIADGERTVPETKTDKWKSGDTDANWSSVKKSDAIRMTDYSVGERIVTPYVVNYSTVRRPYGTIGWIGHNIYNNSCNKYPIWSWLGHAATGKPYDVDEKVYQVSTSLYTDIQNVHLDFPGIQTFGLISGSYRKEKMECMSSVVSDAAGSYDLLTDMAEFRSTAELALKLLGSLKRPTQLVKKLRKDKRPLKMGSDAWMTMRYGIMPTVYSVMDLIKTLDNANKRFLTFRSQKTLNEEFEERDFSVPHLYQEGSSSVRISATAKLSYSNTVQNLFDRVTTNPFLTGWELVPFSWMIDWFVDVGGWIEAQSHQYSSLADSEAYCLATRINRSINTFLYIPGGSQVESFNGFYNPYSGDKPPKEVTDRAIRYRIANPVGGSFLLQTEEENSYSRVVFKPGDVELQFNPNLNWKRGIDALAVSSQKFKSSFRRLK